MLLPVLPSISAFEYFNAMSLATIWKFGFLGLAMAFGIVANNNTFFSFNKFLSFHVIGFIAMIIVASVCLIMEKTYYKLLATLFILSLALHGAILYLSVWLFLSLLLFHADLWSCKPDQIRIYEYFNIIRDRWVTSSQRWGNWNILSVRKMTIFPNHSPASALTKPAKIKHLFAQCARKSGTKGTWPSHSKLTS